MSKKLNKIFGSDLEHFPVFKALRESNPEQLLVLKAPCGDESTSGGKGGGALTNERP